MTKRRANGEGSVYERSNGRYVGEYEDATGKRRYVSGKSKAAVRAKLKERLKDKEEGIAVESQNLTVEKYFDQWLYSIPLNAFRAHRTRQEHQLYIGVGLFYQQGYTAVLPHT